MAEAILNLKGKGLWLAESAGSRPADHVNPRAIAAMERHGLRWTGHAPRGLDGLEKERWDFVITVCDRAKEACPYFPGQPVIAHWGMEDPADAQGTDEQRSRAFDLAWQTLSRRIDLLLALPVEKLEHLALEHGVQAIGTGT